MVLGGFMFIIGGMFFAILNKNGIEGEWKELLLLLLGAFIGSFVQRSADSENIKRTDSSDKG
jgi:hypothetical protein